MTYNEESIRTLDGLAHIRLRKAMYIGRGGEGSGFDDGIYILFKEVIDNSIDEFKMGNGKVIDVEVDNNKIAIRDYGRGIPLGSLIDAVSKVNTSGKFDSNTYKKSVGLHGVGLKAANALSIHFKIVTYRDGSYKEAIFSQGNLVSQSEGSTKEKNGVYVEFIPEDEIFGGKVKFNKAFIEERIWNYCYLNKGLLIKFNGQDFKSQNGIVDLLNKNVDDTIRYPIVYLEDENLEVAFTHNNAYGEHYYSFVNGQHTNDGGTHQQAFKEAFVKVIRSFFKKDYDTLDIRASLVATISISIVEPAFESQTKNKLGSDYMSPGNDGIKIKKYVEDFMVNLFEPYLHKNVDVANAILRRIQQSERERKEISGIKKLANDRAKKANLCNKKLRDCKFHKGDKNAPETMIFIVEGDSAAGSVTTARNGDYQAVFPLKGKPLNTFGMTKKVCYENEELNLLQHALGVEDGDDTLRYDKIIISADADSDGLHITTLLLTYFAQFYSWVIEGGHLYCLETPLFRVRDSKTTIYCYDEKERDKAMAKLKNCEVTRFKGLGEISPDEYRDFIEPEKIRLQRVPWSGTVSKTLEFFMGKNTPEKMAYLMAEIDADLRDL